jgi:RHS repeat-associated protein
VRQSQRAAWIQDRAKPFCSGYAEGASSGSASSISTTAWRPYDPWGTLRTGSALGGASQRYCASLGHVTDDESGLVYMRVRSYEPWTGRFVSEDPARDGSNLYVYCLNSPTEYIDETGQSPTARLLIWLTFAASLVQFTVGQVLSAIYKGRDALHLIGSMAVETSSAIVTRALDGVCSKILGQMEMNAEAGEDASLKGVCGAVILRYCVYAAVLWAALAAIAREELELSNAPGMWL